MTSIGSSLNNISTKALSATFTKSAEAVQHIDCTHRFPAFTAESVISRFLLALSNA
ncbi:hypothetical protein L915_19871 [Phytophthora nicotianae]|uniref:Uncharacterized protein n=1 Tax=Phytophthora nicotianae TaxID=4792 RepID=W2FQW1_PHYNI|nr:hypothetical protein L915_19871 [Phytophthora nicotianae]ETL26607.1 hypothetical protein L916_19752 [Phytophthora nicotianae]